MKITPMRALLAIVLVVCAFCFAAQAGAPSRQSVTMTAGSGTFTYSDGLQNPAFNMFRVQTVIGPSAVGTTNVYTVIDGGVTNLLGSGTNVVAANQCALTITNDNWHFIGDSVPITSSDTNALTFYLIIEEQ